MKKLPFERQVHFRSGKVLEVNRRNQDEDSSSPEKTKNGTCNRSRASTTSQNYEFSY